MTLLLGVDGGGSGCRVRLADRGGQVLAEATGGPANITTDPDGALANILGAARQAAQRAFPDEDAGRVLARTVAGLGLAGAIAAGAAERLAPHLPFARLRIENDALTTVLGALDGADGIVAAMGTGSVFADWRAGRFRQIGGWGFLLGDEGSGAVLGRAILARALRAADGCAPMTPLLAGLLDRHGGQDGILRHALAARPADFATLAPLLFASDDPAAQAVLDAAAADVAGSIDRLHSDGALPVTWVGGLGPAWAARIGNRWGQRAARGTALDGALRMAAMLA